MNTSLIFLTTFASYIILDLLWLGVVARPIITRLLSPWMTNGFKMLPAFIVYVLLAVAMTFLVIPRATSFPLAIIWGAILGLVVYGVYDLTNYATISGWPIKFVVLDMAW